MARLFLTYAPDAVTFRGRMEGPGGLVGDFRRVLRPGESLAGRTFEEWVRLHPTSIDAQELSRTSAE